MASLSISAEDFTTAGSVPRAGLRVRMQVVGAFTVGDKTVSHVPWEMVTDDTGAASTVLPDAVAGVGVQVSIPAWAGFGFTIAGYPDEDLTITGVGDWVVDPRTLQPSAASFTAWEATLAQVQQIADGLGPGESAYQIAVDAGFVGSEADWLASLVGPAGPANALSIGTVTTGAPGSQASASITGTTPAQVLDLTIPAGADGSSGATVVSASGDTTGATDTAAINAAITSVSSAGGGVVLLTGIFWVNAPVSLQTGVILEGVGWQGTQLHLVSGANCAVINVLGGAAGVEYHYGVRDLLIDGHKENQAAGSAGIDTTTGGVTSVLTDTNCTPEFIQRVKVQYTWGHGVLVNGHVETRVEDVYAFRCGTTASHNGFNLSGSDGWLINCTSGESYGDGILFVNTTLGFRLIGCKSWFSGVTVVGASMRTTHSSLAANVVNSNASNYTITGSNHLISACESQDSGCYGWSILGSNCRFFITSDYSKSAHLMMRGATRNIVQLNCGSGTSHGTTPYLVNVWDSGPTGNRIESNFYLAQTGGGVTAGVVGGGASSGKNVFSIGPQVPAPVTYAASLTPDPFTGGIDTTLTGNVTIANPASDRAAHGTEFEVCLTQDATGSRTVTWGTQYVAPSAINTAPGTVTRWRFRCINRPTGISWIQVGSWPA